MRVLVAPPPPATPLLFHDVNPHPPSPHTPLLVRGGRGLYACNVSVPSSSDTLPTPEDDASTVVSVSVIRRSSVSYSSLVTRHSLFVTRLASRCHPGVWRKRVSLCSRLNFFFSHSQSILLFAVRAINVCFHHSCSQDVVLFFARRASG